MLRHPTKEDSGVLSRHGIAEAAGRTVYVLERDGVVTGALAASAKPFESGILHKEVSLITTLTAWGNDADLDEIAREGLARLAENGVGLAVCRLAETERRKLAALQNAGMAVVECLMTLSHPLEQVPEPAYDVFIASEADADGVMEVARGCFMFDRFHADPFVDKTGADALKAAWAGNNVRGRADCVFVTRDGSRITGFNSCLLQDGVAIIDLIGIDPRYQGKGLGRALTAAALQHYRGRAKRMRVGTQSANHVSLNLYLSAGFRIEETALTFHAHLPRAAQ